MGMRAKVRALLRPAPEPENERLIRAGILRIGRHTYGDPRVITFQTPAGAWMSDKVSIGAFCSFAPGVQIFTGGIHCTDYVTTFPLRSRWDLPGRDADMKGQSRGPVTIGNDVWVATEAIIMSGVVIGDGAVIATRAVVTRDVRPYAIVVGSPAKEVRRRFDDATVDRLLRLAWWNWSDDEIRKRVNDLEAPPDFDRLDVAAHRSTL